MAAFKTFFVVALICCCGTMVLSTDVKEARRRMAVEDANMHPKRIAPAVKKLGSERVKMREMDTLEEAMHPRRPKEQETVDPARHGRPREIDDAMMHPRKSKSAQTPVKKPNVHNFIEAVPDRMKMRGIDDGEARMHPQVTKLKKQVRSKKQEMDDAMMHPRVQNRGSKNAVHTANRELMRRMDEEESKMHRQIRSNYGKANPNPRARRQAADLDGLHPRPAIRDTQPIGKSHIRPPQKMDESLMHPHVAMELPKDDPAVDFDEEALNIEAVLGPDFIHRFDFADRALHPDNSKSRQRKTPSREQMDKYEGRMHPKRSANTQTKPRQLRSVPPGGRKINERVMHPRVAKAVPKDDPAVDFDDEEIGVEAVLGPDFIHQFDFDDRMLHPDGGRSKARKVKAKRGN